MRPELDHNLLEGNSVRRLPTERADRELLLQQLLSATPNAQVDCVRSLRLSPIVEQT